MTEPSETESSPTVPPPPAAEDLPGGSSARLRERQRRWFAERDRFETAHAEPGASPETANG